MNILKLSIILIVSIFINGCVAPLKMSFLNSPINPPPKPVGYICTESIKYSSISNRQPLLKYFDESSQKWVPQQTTYTELPVGNYKVGIYYNNGINLAWILEQGNPPAPETVQEITVEEGMISIIRYKFKSAALTFRCVFDQILPVEKLPCAYRPDATQSALSALKDQELLLKQQTALLILKTLSDPKTIDPLKEILDSKKGMVWNISINQTIDSIIKSNKKTKAVNVATEPAQHTP